MPQRTLGVDVFSEALTRLVAVYEQGHRVVISFSAGKDSGVCLELCIMAATMTNRLPVEVVMRDEEIMFPGTYEYAERVAARPEVEFHWLVARQPIVNVFNRTHPYWWVFDPQLSPEEWVRQPPAFAEYITDLNIAAMTTPMRFPPPEGKHLVDVIGLRVSESPLRRAGLHSSRGYLTGVIDGKVRCRPIYDWQDGDIWRAIHEQKWDYNSAYDVMFRMGFPRPRMRIGPPTMTWHGVSTLHLARAAWPRWFDRLDARLPGMRTVAMFGKRAVLPSRRLGETWKDCFLRECVTEAPAPWIRERSEQALEPFLASHRRHSTQDLPDVRPCPSCNSTIAAYKNLALTMYNGNPFALKMDNVLPYMEPEFFRTGAGYWGGKPSW